jgi:pyridoxamine 5'-phosphate oxidase
MAPQPGTSLRPSEPPFGRLTRDTLTAEPMALFRRWFDEARRPRPEGAGMRYPDAVVLTTLRPDGFPDGRIVLLKELDDDAFVVYSNLDSSKGRALAAHDRAGMVFYWDAMGRQVRVRGRTETVAPERADAYFASRPRASRIGAWASEQSRPVPDRATLEARVAALEERFAGGDVPRPSHWTGIRLVPDEVEFWQEGEHRLHDRFLYTRDGRGWRIDRLNP